MLTLGIALIYVFPLCRKRNCKGYRYQVNLQRSLRMPVRAPEQWRAEGGGQGGAWPPGASLGGGARPACRG